MLQVKGLRSGYGRLPVLHGVDIDVQKGEILLVIGPNGAGKTTLLKTIAGFLKPTAGEIVLAGRPIIGLRPDQMSRIGLRLILEGHRIFPGLSVRQNLLLGKISNPSGTSALERIRDALSLFPILESKLAAFASDLSGGQQQMLALAQAFVSEPGVIMCDELSLGLAQALVPQILESMRSWADSGTSIVLVEQYAELALKVADRVVVMSGGEVILNSPAHELQDNESLRALYLGAT